MNEDVALELACEKQRHRARIAAANDARVHGALKVFGENAKSAPRRRLLVLGVERHDDRRLPRRHVHLHRDRRPDDGGDERHELLGEAAEDDARVGRGIGRRQLVEKLRDLHVAPAHRCGEELLFRGEMPEDRRGRDTDRPSNVGERRRGEAAVGERDARGLEDLLAVDAGGSAHVRS